MNHEDEDDGAGGLALPPGTQIEDYEILRVLGAGGFGITYLARDHRLEGDVAIKEYLPADWATRRQDGRVAPRSRSSAENFNWGLNRVLEEARILRRLDHPSVVRVIRHLDALDTGFIVMEFVPGQTLESALRRDGPWDEARLKPLLDDLFDACKRVHENGLLHRDIKPANIILRPDGRPVLIDFGAARQAVGSQSRSVTAVVSPGFGPIEQYAAKSLQGPYTDIYALAATAYCALTGEEPVSAPDRMEADPLTPLVAAAKGRGRPAFLAACDAGLRVMSKDRPQTIDAWRAAFPGPEQAKREGPRPIDRRLLIAGGVGAVVVVGGAAALLGRGGGGGGVDPAKAPPGALNLAKPDQVRLAATDLVQDGDWTSDALWTRCAFAGQEQVIACSQGSGATQRASIQVFKDGVARDWTAPAGSRASALAAAEGVAWVGGDDRRGGAVAGVQALDLGGMEPRWTAPLGPGKVLALSAGGGRLLAAVVSAAGGAAAILDLQGRELARFTEPGAVIANVQALEDGGGLCCGWKTPQGMHTAAFVARFDGAGRLRWRYDDADAQRSSRALAVTTDVEDAVFVGRRAREGDGPFADGLLRRLDLATGQARPASAGGEVLIRRTGTSSLRGVATAARGVYYVVGAAFPSAVTKEGSGALALLIDAAGRTLSESYDFVSDRTAAAECVALNPGQALLVSGFTAPGDRSSATPTLTRYVTPLKAG